MDQLVFKQLVDVQFPTLAAHLELHGVNVASVSTQWFLCLFVNSLPLETCLRVWDMFFLERCASLLFRIALTLVDIYSLVGRTLSHTCCLWLWIIILPAADASLLLNAKPLLMLAIRVCASALDLFRGLMKSQNQTASIRKCSASKS